MKKIINPCNCKIYNGMSAKAYAKIDYEDGRLSICGVIGPKSNGDCLGSCGQCIDEIKNGIPVGDWTSEMLRKFCNIWEEWHLNDMRPYCEHQKQLGWEQLASKKVTQYQYSLKREAWGQQKAAETAALSSLKAGKHFTPTEEQIMFANMPYSIVSHKELSADMVQYYELRKSLYPGDRGATEEKLLGWLHPKEHPDGILSKPCPVCGYEYGSAWNKQDVPEDVITWLFSLPESKVVPAWL